MKVFTHLDDNGAANMVDVSAKEPTLREAIAEGRITMSSNAATAIREQSVVKGDVLAVARVAGIMAAKNTSLNIPLCHPLKLSSVTLDLFVEEEFVAVRGTVRAFDVTGVEMEALNAVSVALLSVYDMVKSMDRGMTIGGIALVSKLGGRSGVWRANHGQ
jgi:cyclic pyranopterin monophosphate synthase